ncbi:hypothetical protein HWV62_23879 [Athelia sp. TMB]|nr:hypothetical protein HWV62_23879 [Athelia sp. TMB]
MSRLLGRATGLINALQDSRNGNGQQGQGQGGYGQQGGYGGQQGGYGRQQQGGSSYNGPLSNSRLYGLYKFAEGSMGKGQKGGDPYGQGQAGQNPYGQQDQYGQQPPNPYAASGSSYGPQGGASPYGPQGGASGGSPYGPQGGSPNPSIGGYAPPPGGPSPYGPQGGSSSYGSPSPYGPQAGAPSPYGPQAGAPSPYGPQSSPPNPYGPQGGQSAYAPPPPPRTTSAGSGNADLSCSDFIENLILENPVMVFSRENSADGAFVKAFFEEHYTGLHVEYFDIHPDDPLILPHLVDRSKTAQKYNGKKKVQLDVPFIFIDKVYIGGLKELKEMRKADIVGLLQGRR